MLHITLPQPAGLRSWCCTKAENSEKPGSAEQRRKRVGARGLRSLAQVEVEESAGWDARGRSGRLRGRCRHCAGERQDNDPRSPSIGYLGGTGQRRGDERCSSH
jgi:hypothetical protein